MVILTLGYSWALRPSPQKLPAPPRPHTSQRSVSRQTPQWSLEHFYRSCFLFFLLNLHLFSFHCLLFNEWRYFSDWFASAVESKPSCCMCLCVWWFYALRHQTVKGGISETRIEKRIVISGDADIDHDQVSYSFCSFSSFLLIILKCAFREWIKAFTLTTVKYWWTVVCVTWSIVWRITNHGFPACWHVNWKYDTLPPHLPYCLSSPFGSSWHCISTCRLWLRP